MSIIRVEKKTKGFSVIDNTPFEDKKLSWSAKGLMGYLLTKPDSWHVRMEDLYKSSPQGEHATRNIVKELIDKGYIVREKVKGKRGRFEWEYVVFEKPTIWHFSTDGASTDGASTYGEVPHIVNTNRVNTDNNILSGKTPTVSDDLLRDIKEGTVTERADLSFYNTPEQLKAKEKSTSAKPPKKAKEPDPFIKQVIDYLNEKADKNFEATSKTAKKLIPARQEEGHGWNQFKAVIDYKVQEWGDGKEIDGKAASFYLRPETLFTTENFSKYLDEAREAYKLAQKKPKAASILHTNTKTMDDHRKEWGG